MATSAPVKVGFERILVPVDFTDVSKHAVEYAKSISRRFQSAITLAHVTTEISPATPPEVVWFENLSVQHPAEQQLSDWIETLQSDDLPCKGLMLNGGIQEEILRSSEAEHSDLIIAGTHGRAGLSRLLFGSDAEGIYRHSKCPIMVVGPMAKPIDGSTWRPRSLIFATDLNPSSAVLAAEAFSLAQQLDATLTIFHVDDTQGRVAKATRQAIFEEALQPMLPPNHKPVYIWRTLMLGFSVGATVANLARERQADLILMGARLSSQAQTHFANGIAPQTIARAQCPVPILHRPG